MLFTPGYISEIKNNKKITREKKLKIIRDQLTKKLSSVNTKDTKDTKVLCYACNTLIER